MRINAERIDVDEYECSFFADGRKARDIFFINADFKQAPHFEPHRQQARKTVGQFLRRGFLGAPFTAVAQLCTSCNECLPLRIDTHKFALRNNQRRKLNKFDKTNLELLETTPKAFPFLVDALSDLYKTYVDWRFPGTEMSKLDNEDRAALISESPNISVIVDGTTPVAFALTSQSKYETSLDVIAYNPEYKNHSLGAVLFLKTILSAHEKIVPYVYIGMTNESKALKYKQDYSGLETYDGEQWVDYNPQTHTQGPNYEQIIKRLDIKGLNAS